MIEQILHELEQFKIDSKKRDTTNDERRSVDNDDKPPYYNHTLMELSKILYLYTKEMLNTGALTPTEKVAVLNKYIKVWAKSKCELDIKNTEFAELYEKSRFGKYNDHYNKRVPMVAGFDLSGVNLANLDYSFLIFLSNNFKNADFSNAQFPYSHFENCDLSGINTNRDSNLNQCKFVNCNLSNANIENAQLSEVKITDSDITNMKMNQDRRRELWIYDCIDDNEENKECVSKEINQQLQQLEAAKSPAPIQNKSTAYLLTAMNQYIFSTQQTLTSFLVNSFKEKELPQIADADKLIIDKWLEQRLDMIKRLPAKEAIEVLLHLLKDPRINYRHATATSIKETSNLLNALHPQKLLNLTTTNKKDLVEYIRHKINKTILDLFIDNHIVEDLATESPVKVDVDKLVALVNKMMDVRNALVDKINQYHLTERTNALQYLINIRKLPAIDAYRELGQLNDYQTDALVDLYDYGMRAKHLLSFQNNDKKLIDFRWQHGRALSSLIKTHHLTPEEAMSEINGLSEEQVEALQDQYGIGVRGKHLRDWQAGRYAVFGHTQAKTLKYLIIEQHLSPDQAIAEINELTYERCEALTHLYSFGLRGDTLRPMSNFFEWEKDALISLVKDQNVGVDVAINQLNQFGKHEGWYAKTLAKLYSNGLRSEHLLKYESTWDRENNFTSDHYSALKYLIQEEGLAPDQAIKEITLLSCEAAQALKSLYKHGLRGTDVRYWNNDPGGYNDSRCHALIVLVLDRGKPVKEALNILHSIDCSHALSKLADEYRYELDHPPAMRVS